MLSTLSFVAPLVLFSAPAHYGLSPIAFVHSRRACFGVTTPSMGDGRDVPVPDDASSSGTIRVLALHGSENTAESMTSTLHNWRDVLQQTTGMHMDITAVQAPFVKNNGFCWWKLAPHERLFNATSFDGYAESKAVVLDAIQHDDYDLMVGHSQGAILLTAMLADQSLQPHQPPRGYVLNGVAWPNPFTNQLESLQLSHAPPRVLIICGQRDEINPPAQQERVKAALIKAGADVTLVQHPQGHDVPIDNDATMELIIKFITHNIKDKTAELDRKQIEAAA